MTRAPRSWVVASHPRFCGICEGRRAVLLAPVDAPERSAPVPCPHCQSPYLAALLLVARKART